MAKQMTLQMWLRANAEQAKSAIADTNRSLERLSGGMSKVGDIGGATFGAIRGFGSVFFAPLVMATKAAAALAAGIGAVGAAAVANASGDEAYINRLTMLYGNADKAKQKFAELESISRGSPFDSGDLTEATIMLDQVGITGSDQLTKIAAAAKMAGMSTSELTTSIATLQARSLKRMGIEMEQKGDATEIGWTDRSGQKMTRLAMDAKRAREILIDVLGEKGGGGIGPETFRDTMAMLRNNIGQMFGNIGADMLKPLTKAADDMASYLRKHIEDGTFAEIGKKAAEWIEAARVNLMAGLAVARDLMAKVFSGDGVGIAETLQTAMNAGAQVLIQAIFAAITGTAQFWKGVGEMLAAVFMDKLIQIPGMKYMIDRGPDADQVLRRGVRDTMGAVPGIVDTIRNSASVGFSDVNKAARSNLGYDIKGNFEAYRKEAAGGGNIFIERLEVKADDPARLQEQIQRKAGMPHLVAASA